MLVNKKMLSLHFRLQVIEREYDHLDRLRMSYFNKK